MIFLYQVDEGTSRAHGGCGGEEEAAAGLVAAAGAITFIVPSLLFSYTLTPTDDLLVQALILALVVSSLLV